MPTQAERREMIAKIRQAPGLVEQAVRGLSDAQLDTPYGEGKWTPRQVVHHLADGHMNAFIRFKAMLTEDHPTLKTYDQDGWAETADCVGMKVESSLSILRGLHERWCFLMEQCTESEWNRKGIHPERGELSLDDLLRIYAGHGAKHAGTITDLRKRKGW